MLVCINQETKNFKLLSSLTIALCFLLAAVEGGTSQLFWRSFVQKMPPGCRIQIRENGPINFKSLLRFPSNLSSSEHLDQDIDTHLNNSNQGKCQHAQ